MLTFVLTLLLGWALSGLIVDANISADAWLIFAGLFILSLANELKS